MLHEDIWKRTTNKQNTHSDAAHRKYLYFLKQMKYNTKFGENQRGQIQSAMIYCTSSGTKSPHKNSKQKLEIQPGMTNILKSEDGWKKKN